MKFVIGSPDGGLVTLHAEKSRSSPEKALLANGDKVVAIPQDENNDPEWHFVRFDVDMGTSPPIEGWVEFRNLKEREADAGPRLSLEIAPFVRSCARIELIANAAGGTNTSTIVADYLLAWANVESATAEGNYSNPPPDFEGSDAEGPFRLTSAEWQAYMDTVNQPDPYVSEFERSIPTCQVAGATFITQNQLDEFAKLAVAGQAGTDQPAPSDGPFIPSYLNALHCRLIGVANAFHFHEVFTAGGGAVSVDDALAKNTPDEAARKLIIANRKSFLVDRGSATTVQRFFLRTSDALSKGFKGAYRNILEHASYLLPPPETVAGPAPWMAVAEQELAIWKTEDLNEARGKGLQKVIEYFKSVAPSIQRNEAWCGAFVGHCLSKSTPSFGSTIVKKGQFASSWADWGNVRLRIHHLREIPVGALVVTVPMSEGTTGHVGFFVEKVDGEESIRLHGGNQSNIVSKTFKVKKNNLREIRWLDSVDPTPADSADTTVVPGSPVNATEGEVLTLARTLYGEARGEVRKGIEAVANVVINRVRRRFFGSSVGEVCKKPSQFSCWNRTDPNFRNIANLKPNNGNRIFDTCFDIAGKAVRGQISNHVGEDTLHYHATYIRPPDWVRNSRNPRVTLRLGGHIFYANID